MNVNAQTATEVTKLETFTYKWEIGNWLTDCNNFEPGKYIMSPSFKILNGLCRLFIYPSGIIANLQEYISLTLHLFYNDGIIPDLRYSLSLATNENRLIANYDSKKKVSITTRSVDQFVSKSAVAECIRAASADKIIVVCKIMTQEEDSLEAPLNLCAHATQHLQVFESFVNNERFSDVKIKIEDKEIFAHKMILSAHSPVFAAMFEHDMRENEENVVAVVDVSYEAFCELLRYVYLGKSDFVKETVGDLFKAADKYQLLKLKKICEMELCRNISIDNVFDSLSLADMHNAVDLKKEATDFVVDHMTKIIHGPKLEALKNLDTSLFREILQRTHTEEQS